jgi:hypothetical protein
MCAVWLTCRVWLAAVKVARSWGIASAPRRLMASRRASITSM